MNVLFFPEREELGINPQIPQRFVLVVEKVIGHDLDEEKPLFEDPTSL